MPVKVAIKKEIASISDKLEPVYKETILPALKGLDEAAFDQFKVFFNPKALKDRDGFAALKAISDYKPANEDFTVSKVQTAQDELLSKRDTEAQKMGDWEAARDDATSAEWSFHNAMLAAKDQVKAQYGENSNELHAVGLKKKSEYKSPHHKVAVPA